MKRVCFLVSLLMIVCIMGISPPARADTTQLIITHPSGGERLPAGSTQDITWEGYEDYELEIYLSVDSGETYDIFIGSGSGGAFSWVVPDISTNRARIKVTGQIQYLTRAPVTVEGTSDSDFSIGRLPEAPTDLAAKALSTSEILLTWQDNSDNEEGFSVERNQHEVFTVGADVQEAVHGSLPPETVYSYRVRAYNAFGYSDYSNTVRVATLPEDPLEGPPQAPSRLTAEVLSPTEILLTWVDNADNEDGFTIERDGEAVAELAEDEETFTDAGLSADTTYTYRIRAFNDHGYSEYSDQVEVTIPPTSVHATVIQLGIGRPELYVDGIPSIMDAVPIIEQDRTLLPMRPVTEALGGQIDWDASERKVTVALGNVFVHLWIGKNTATVNGVEQQIDAENPEVVPAIVPPGRTMLPLRFVVEALGCEVAWDDITREVTVTYDPDFHQIRPELLSDCSDNVIDFEDLPAGEQVFNQYGELGVTFPTVPAIVEPATIQPSSGTQALSIDSPGEFAGMIAVEFTTAQNCVSMMVGLPDDSGGNKVSATLKAFDVDKPVIIPGYGMEVHPAQQVAVHQSMLGPGPADVDRKMVVSTGDEAEIYRVELSLSGGYLPVIGDLRFATVGEPYPDPETRPRATIEVPNDGDVISGFGPDTGAIDLMGTVHEEFKLKSVDFEVIHEDGVLTGQLPFTGEAPDYTFGGPNVHGLISPGENLIRVTPRSFAYSPVTYRDSVTIHYEPVLTGEMEAELLILTPDEFYSELQPLRQWKNATGISTHIMTLSSIERDQRFAGSRDLPEQVKRAIAHAYQHNGTRYVMLVGDGDRFPVRYFKTGRDGVSWGVIYPITDLYYACLFKDGEFDDWDGNQNGIIGEWWSPPEGGGYADSFEQMNIDGCSLKPDVALGRVPASTAEEVAIYVNKVIEYEADSTSAYDNIVLWNGTSDFRSDHHELDYVADELLSDFTAKKHYRPDNYESWDSDQQQQYRQQWKDELFADLKEDARFAIYFGHGSRQSMGVLTASDVQGLDNAGSYPVFVASACDTAKFVHEFDIYVDVDGNYPPCWPSCPPDEGDTWPGPNPEPAPIQPSVIDVDSMAEALLLAQDAGGVGFLGARSGTNTASHPFVKLFIDGYNQEGGDRLGGMWVNGVTDFVEQYLETDHWFGRSNLMSRHIHFFVLFGDPSLRLKD